MKKTIEKVIEKVTLKVPKPKVKSVSCEVHETQIHPEGGGKFICNICKETI